MYHNTLLFLGIDIGTSGVRALAVTESGEVVHQETVAFDYTRDTCSAFPYYHEQSPQSWHVAVCQATSRLVAELERFGASRDNYTGVAIDGTSGTLVALDAKGLPLRPAMMYNDPRGSLEARLINAAAAPFVAKHGYQFASSFAAAKIGWLAGNELDTFNRAARFVHQADYIQEQLTGRPAVTDYSNALKTGYDLVDECWPGWIDIMFGASIRDRLPCVVPPGTKVRCVSAQAAEATGLPAGLPVVTGASDGTAACLASGLRRPGDYNTTLGTTLVFKGISPTICRHPEGLIYSHKLPGGLWLPGAAGNVGCQWIKNLFLGADPAVMDARAADLLPGDVAAYPLTRRGERFPFLSPEAEGFFLPEPADEPQRWAACLTGTALVERLCYEELDKAIGGTNNGQVFATGGGSRSDVWMQCRADATGRVLHRPACGESAFGAALLAAAGTLYGDLDTAMKMMVRIDRSFLPNYAATPQYDRLYERFRDELHERGYR